jgi:hypothetical protein
MMLQVANTLFYICCFLVAIVSNGENMNISKNEDNSLDYEIYVNEIIRNFAREMRQKYNLYSKADGGRMPHDVEEIEMDFIFYQKVNIEQARELEVMVTEGFVKCINAHEKIRPFLREYPFTYKRALVSIVFYDSNNNYWMGHSVDFVFNIRGEIFYKTFDPQTKKFCLLHKEPYEKSLEIVRNKNNAIP